MNRSDLDMAIADLGQERSQQDGHKKNQKRTEDRTGSGERRQKKNPKPAAHPEYRPMNQVKTIGYLAQPDRNLMIQNVHFFVALKNNVAEKKAEGGA